MATNDASINTAAPAGNVAADIEPLVLTPADLTSKWGFEDGDMGYDQIVAWARSGVWAKYFPADESEFEDNPARAYLSQRTFLLALVTRHLGHLVPPGYKLYRIMTVHNPVRAEPDMEPENESYDKLYDRLVSMLEGCDDVVVTAEQIAALCDELFPHRPLGWMQLYQAIWSDYHVVEEITQVYPPAANAPAEDRGRSIARFVDAVASEHSDDELLLTAEMIMNQRVDRSSIADVRAALESSRTLLR